MIGYGLAFFAGLSLGVLGGGGSILTVPILVYFFQIPASQATSYSLFTVGTTSLIGTFFYLRNKQVDWKIGGLYTVFSLLGVTLSRRVILPAIPNTVLTSPYLLTRDKLVLAVFSLVMLLAARSMIKKPKAVAPPSGPRPFAKIAVLAFCVGILIGFVGAGGGFLIVPVLVLLGQLPIRLAVGTSLFIIALGGINGFSQDLLVGKPVDWNFLLPFSAVSVVGVMVGIRIARHIPTGKLKPAFGWMVLLVACAIILAEIL